MARKEEATLILKIKKVGERTLESIKTGLVNIGKAAGIAATAITAFVGAGVRAFRQQELAVNKLNTSLANQGIFTEELSQKYQDMASALQKVTTFGDEAIISSQAQLQSYLGNIEVTEELTKSTLDFAAAMGIDLKSAADLIGKSIGSSTNALTRYGITIDSGATKQEKMAQVVTELNKKFGGQAEAAAQGLGSMEQFNNAFGDFLEKVGERAAPLIAEVTKRLISFGK
jgi:hypothetical protein